MFAKGPRKKLMVVEKRRECGADIPEELEICDGSEEQKAAVQKYNTEQRRLCLAIIQILTCIKLIELLPLVVFGVPLRWILALW